MAKTAKDENFPVGSFLIARPLRPLVWQFYQFARSADDIADDPVMTAEQKLSRLAEFEAKAMGMPEPLRRHGLSLLEAFRRDADFKRPVHWDDLLEYCRWSAAPVGRFLLDLHGESEALYPASDALCAVLQVINHLQDCGMDYRRLQRVYVPEQFLPPQVTCDLAQDRSSLSVRRAVNRILLHCRPLMEQAQGLHRLKNRRLRAETLVILSLAQSLLRRLARQDPLAETVGGSAWDKVKAVMVGVSGVGRRGMGGCRSSSFYWAMRLLARPKRQAMFALYAFCRVVDDIVDDGPDSVEERLVLLQAWRHRVEALFEGKADHPITLALVEPVRAFALPKADFIAVIDGMAMDARDEMVRPSAVNLDLYCDRVAAAVGRLTLRIFGFDDLDPLAAHLGLALQLTNILRDLDEDAARGRLYIADEVLTAHGIGDRDPYAVLAHPALPDLCCDIAARARREFVAARRILSDRRCHSLRPVGLMAALYTILLDRLEASAWASPIRLTVRQRLGCVLRWMILPYPWSERG